MYKVNNRPESESTKTLPLIWLYLGIFFLTMALIGFWPSRATASVEARFLYNLSNFSGPIPYTWAKIYFDEKSNEIYVVDPREGEVRVFNDLGMEIYRFGG